MRQQVDEFLEFVKLPSPSGAQTRQTPRQIIEDAVRDALHLEDDAAITDEKCQNVTTLDLRNQQVTDEALSELRRLPRLQSLLLGGTLVSDSGLAHLAGLIELRTLHVANTLVGD